MNSNNKMNSNHNGRASKADELAYMMCEKITHLTKVIYSLNAKHEESESMIQSIINSYEKELWQMVKEANAAMSILKEKVKKLSQDSPLKDNLRLIEDKYNQSLRAFTSAYDKLKQEAHERELALHKETQSKVDQMRHELITIRQEAEEKLKEYKAKEDERKQVLEGKANEMQKANSELQMSRKEAEMKMEGLQQELKLQLDKAKSDSKKLSEKDSLIKAKDKKIKEQSEELEVIKVQAEATEANLVNITTQLTSAKKEVKSLKEAEKELKEKLKQSDDAVKESKLKSEEVIKEQKSSNEKVISELKGEIERFNKQIKSNEYNEVVIKEKSEVIAKLDVDYKALIVEQAKAKDIIDNLNKTIQMNQSKLNDNDSKSNKLLQENQALNQKLLSLTKEVSEFNKKSLVVKDNETVLKAQVEKLKTDFSTQEKALRTTYDTQLSTLDKQLNENKKSYEEQKATEQQKSSSTINTLTSSVNQLTKRAKELEDQLKANTEDYAKRSKESKEGLTKEMEDFQAKCKAQQEEETKRIQINASVALNQVNQQMKQQKTAFIEEKLSFESKHREEIDRITFQSSLRLNEVQLGLESQISTLKIENIQLKEKIEECSKSTVDTSNQSKRGTLVPITQRSIDIEGLIQNLKREVSTQKEESKSPQTEGTTKLMKDNLEALMLLQDKNSSLSNEVNELRLIVKNRPSREKDIQEIQQLKELLYKKEKSNKVAHCTMNEIKERETETSVHMERNDSYFKQVKGSSGNQINTYNKLATMTSSSNKTQKMLNGVKQFKLKAINSRSTIR